MNKRKKNKMKPKYVLIIFAFICLILIGISYQTRNSQNVIQSAISTVTVPMQKGLNSVGYWISDKLSTSRTVSELEEELAALESTNEELRGTISKLQNNQEDLNTLLELLEMTERFPNYDMVGARIVGKDAGNWYNTFVIDKGSSDGIKEGMNVVANNALVGIVYETSYHSSKVRAIIDDVSSVSAMNNNSKDRCIVNGDLQLMDEGYLQVEMITVNSSMKEGDEIVTSYISDKFLPGLPIGYLTELVMDENNMTQSARLIPIVDFEHLTDVLVILQLKEELVDGDGTAESGTDLESETPASSDTTPDDTDEPGDNGDSGLLDDGA